MEIFVPFHTFMLASWSGPHSSFVDTIQTNSSRVFFLYLLRLRSRVRVRLRNFSWKKLIVNHPLQNEQPTQVSCSTHTLLVMSRLLPFTCSPDPLFCPTTTETQCESLSSHASWSPAPCDSITMSGPRRFWQVHKGVSASNCLSSKPTYSCKWNTQAHELLVVAGSPFTLCSQNPPVRSSAWSFLVRLQPSTDSAFSAF